MELTSTAFCLILAAAAGIGFWYSSLAARERANGAAQDACERLRLQFLDGTVAFASLTLRRGRGGKLAFRRTYVFDYTADSIERRQGFVILAGTHLESVGFANDSAGSPPQKALPETPPPPPASSLPREIPSRTTSDESGNIVDLAEWRHRTQRKTRQGQRGHGERKG
jgi:hypothetical protein